VGSADLESLDRPGPHAHGEGAILRQEIQRRVHAALLSLKPKLRMVVVFKDIEGLSYDEIAERMSCSKGTVGTWLNRARKLLARKLAGLQGEL
jgi:RNA polymerase sigma-70 factor (ECF subfamily)